MTSREQRISIVSPYNLAKAFTVSICNGFLALQTQTTQHYSMYYQRAAQPCFQKVVTNRYVFFTTAHLNVTLGQRWQPILITVFRNKQKIKCIHLLSSKNEQLHYILSHKNKQIAFYLSGLTMAKWTCSVTCLL